ncbi:MAG: hypothetical protein E6J79_21225 [Deltaproteobacteria bacterium]|nr:MAG: hypothetical protein E6J79_21225 [Deltaproteobacteria bacterium]
MRRLLVACLFLGTTAWAADVRIRGVGAIGMTVSDIEKLGQARPVAVPGHQLGFARGVMVRDRDGHALEIVEP